jgi:hypothetical protein
VIGERVAEAVEQLVERDELLAAIVAVPRQARVAPRPGIEPLELFEREILRPPAAVGRAVERVVVQQQHAAILGEAHVGLGLDSAHVHGTLERRHRVLRRIAAGAAMRDDTEGGGEVGHGSHSPQL